MLGHVRRVAVGHVYIAVHVGCAAVAALHCAIMTIAATGNHCRSRQMIRMRAGRRNRCVATGTGRRLAPGGCCNRSKVCGMAGRGTGSVVVSRSTSQGVAVGHLDQLVNMVSGAVRDTGPRAGMTAFAGNRSCVHVLGMAACIHLAQGSPCGRLMAGTAVSRRGIIPVRDGPYRITGSAVRCLAGAVAIVGTGPDRAGFIDRRARITRCKSKSICQCRRGIRSFAQAIGESKCDLVRRLVAPAAAAAVAIVAAVALCVDMECVRGSSAVRGGKERCPAGRIRAHHHGPRVDRGLAVAAGAASCLNKAVGMERLLAERSVSVHMRVAAAASRESPTAASAMVCRISWRRAVTLIAITDLRRS